MYRNKVKAYKIIFQMILRWTSTDK